VKLSSPNSLGLESVLAQLRQQNISFTTHKGDEGGYPRREARGERREAVYQPCRLDMHVWMDQQLESSIAALRLRPFRQLPQKNQLQSAVCGLFFCKDSILRFYRLSSHFNYIRNCWTEMLARSLGHIIILVHFRSKR
jgi:hypothetical protein